MSEHICEDCLHYHIECGLEVCTFGNEKNLTNRYHNCKIANSNGKCCHWKRSPKAENLEDPTNPDYYLHGDCPETIEVIKAWTSDLEGIEAVCTANIIKYISRWKHKNGVEDLKKLVWYAERLIKEAESDE